MKKILLVIVCAFMPFCMAVAQKNYCLSSPSGKVQAEINVGDELTYDIKFEGREVLAPSPLAMILENGAVWGRNAKVNRAVRSSVDQIVSAEFYRASELKECYNSLTLKMKGGWSVEFRAYNDGVAYRFAHNGEKPFNVADETVAYRFNGDYEATVPYVIKGKDNDWESQFFNSFENFYTTAPLSQLNSGRLAFLPLVVNVGEGVKLCFTEVDMINYPGLFLYNRDGKTELNGMFARVPSKVEAGGYNNIQGKVLERESYIASVDGPRTFPWRAVVVGTDADVAASDLTYLLAEPSRIEDTGWIRPGLVAWDWWNNWNLTGVGFRAGVNTETYKYYVDFAAEQGLEYFLIDDGWAVGRGEDLMQVNPEVNLQEVIDYAASKNVGILLWAGYMAFQRDMDEICRHYSEMGVKGFKVDFMDRDDQLMTAFNHRAAETAAKYKLLLNLHGNYKPAGITRTWPNVLNVEGVCGLENAKWSGIDKDMMKNDVLIPFLRQVAGPMDYTQGAMINGTRRSYRANNDRPMSQGTRCHQMALYMVLDSPLGMLCDSPVHYRAAAECTDFISEIPTVWDETKILAGKMGEYIVTARRKGDVWYVGGLTNWDARELELDLSALGNGACKVKIFSDGINADRDAQDYRRTEIETESSVPFEVRLAPGGGFAMKITF